MFAKGVVARHFSWTAFVASQVVIDCESLYFLLQRAYPVHRFLHTFVGATIAGVATGLGLVAAKKIAMYFAPKLRNLTDRLRPSLRAELSNVGLMVGAVIGGVSHPALDGIMHLDIRPFAPWSDANPLLRLIEVRTLHAACVLLGLAGLIVMEVRLGGEEPPGRKPRSAHSAGRDT